MAACVYSLTTTIAEQNGNEVVFEETIIYPGGGGQPLDVAEVEQNDKTFKVLGARREGEKIFYTLAGELDKTQPVTQKLAWGQRFQNMRYHTLLHLIAGIAANENDSQVTSNEILVDHARIELQFPSPEAKQAFNLEDFSRRVSSEIEASHAIKTKNIDRSQVADENEEVRTLVSLIPAFVTNIRLVEIEGVDSEACAGTHVRNTNEIKTDFVITSKSKGPRKLRLKVELKDCADHSSKELGENLQKNNK